MVTNGGYSDWSVQDFYDNQLTVRVRREGSDYMVEYMPAGTPTDAPWTLMRVAHLHDDDGEMPAHARSMAPAIVSITRAPKRERGQRRSRCSFAAPCWWSCSSS